MKTVFTILILTCISSAGFLQQPGSDVNARFNHLEKEGVKTNKKLAYSYFFYSADKAALEQYKKTLLKKGYNFIKIVFKKNEGYLLEMRKTEKHTRESLKKRIGIFTEETKLQKNIHFHGWNVSCTAAKSLHKN
ncbi:MAG TPA: ribonuclease E inhibitor RraB [Flavobacteriales bacterium]|nr:ribonuclease E inhibitor RraB [Flavobacteriales bacterium]